MWSAQTTSVFGSELASLAYSLTAIVVDEIGAVEMLFPFLGLLFSSVRHLEEPLKTKRKSAASKLRITNYELGKVFFNS